MIRKAPDNVLTSAIAPVNSAVEYKNVVWTAGVEDDKTAYQGHPNEENDHLWEELYNCKPVAATIHIKISNVN